RIEQTHPRKLNIIYFGGEPLLNLQAIRKIGQEIFPFCRQRDVEFSSGMATNGILLTPELVDELKKFGFQWIKITFDGDQCEHDRRRIYKGGKGTFDEIFRKLESVAGKLR